MSIEQQKMRKIDTIDEIDGVHRQNVILMSCLLFNHFVGVVLLFAPHSPLHDHFHSIFEDWPWDALKVSSCHNVSQN